MSKENLSWDRVAPRIERIPESGCWIFLGATNNKGYGHVGIGRNRTALAHRVSYEHHSGGIPDGLMICHTCDVKCCVNPNHLYAGTRINNAQDAVKRRRMPFGQRNGNSKLSDRDVMVIRDLLSTGATSSAVARMFGVTKWTIKAIKARRRHG